MIRFLGQRIFVLLIRLILVFAILSVVIELSYGVFGGSEVHVWQMDFTAPVEPSLMLTGHGGWESVLEPVANSSLVIGITWGVVLLTGYSWGILTARIQRFPFRNLIVLPWLVFACVPGFWWVIQVAIYSYFEWERPGFANEIVVESGPDLMRWWNAVVVAAPLIVLGVAVQIRAVNARIQKESVLPFVRGLYQSGYSNREIFYQNILRRLSGDLVHLSDRTLPLILGGLIFVEAAFRYEGMGNFLLRSLEVSYFPGILVAGLWMAGIIGIVALIREIMVHSLTSD
ncbi:MAG: ABC transporter permease subunit [Verrucomicrobiales bacterium]|nr:ABC transporter permease subunit [Verrucomicrobiales bacterium]